MPFPYTTHANFEAGAIAPFDSETDTGSRGAVTHYRTLARTPGLPMPWRGAYVYAVNLATSTNDAYLTEGAWDLTAGTDTANVRLRVAISSDLVMADTNEFALCHFIATSTVEAGLYVNYTTANGLRLGIGEAAASVFHPIVAGRWYEIELQFAPHASASTLDWWVNGQAGTQVASFASGAITEGRVGVIGQDAGTTTGHVLIDEVIGEVGTSANRIGSEAARFPETLHLFASSHAFVGYGIIDNVSLLSGNATDCVMKLYDTDTAETTDESRNKLTLKNIAANESPVDSAGTPIQLQHGAYISLTGTNPEAVVQIRRAVGYGSDANLRTVAVLQ